jgi:hypothetical protein
MLHCGYPMTGEVGGDLSFLDQNPLRPDPDMPEFSTPHHAPHSDGRNAEPYRRFPDP